MTKIQVLDSNGKKVKEIEGKIFDGKIREDIVKSISRLALIDHYEHEISSNPSHRLPQVIERCQRSSV